MFCILFFNFILLQYHNLFYIIIKIMFQNSYQNGTYFDLFDPKAPQDKTKNLYKLTSVQGNNKVFDKQLKTYVFQFMNSHSKITFPKQDRKQLYLIQPYITFQIFFYSGSPWNIELAVSDLQKTKRRIVLSSATHKLQKKPFFVKYPCLLVKEDNWVNFTVDLYSFINAFKGQTYRSLDSIQISGQFKLRRIFTCQTPPTSGAEDQTEMKPIAFLPKNYYYPIGFQVASHVINYEDDAFLEEAYQPTETSTKNGSQIKKNKTNVSQKSEKMIGYKNEKKFLANTNGVEIGIRKAKRETDVDESSMSESTSKPISKTPAVTEKNISKRKQLGKTHLPKARSSIDKKNTKVEQKKKTQNKLNPWRSNNKRDIQTDGGQITQKNIGDERKIQSAQTTLFKTKNNLASKMKFNQSKNAGFDRKSDHCSDSEYFELSQKFSTLTDGKFFKNELGSQFMKQLNQKQHEQHDQIQQNIEMQTNSMHSSTRKQNHAQFNNTKLQLMGNLNSRAIDESICDSLDDLHQKNSAHKSEKKRQQMFMSSHYGFGQKIMNKFMHDVERPYSPPLGDREQTEECSEFNDKNEQPEKQVELIFDPVLNCYYDHKTHTYYQLK